MAKQIYNRPTASMRCSTSSTNSISSSSGATCARLRCCPPASTPPHTSSWISRGLWELIRTDEAHHHNPAHPAHDRPPLGVTHAVFLSLIN